MKVKEDVTGFVIESDSFAIQTDIMVDDMAPLFKRDFALVVAAGKINLYLHNCTSSSGPVGGIGAVSVSFSEGHNTWILDNGKDRFCFYKLNKQLDRCKF